ncbi:hypothetical protein Tco_0979077 [Tanacetum coccineum]
MTTLKFADTYNMAVFLSKPTESEEFKQIVDFLNANPIKYAQTVNPTIYTLCIEQFWATVKAKTVNEEVQLQALLDGKKVIITESTVRRDLQLEDAEGVDCLPNAAIFEQLTLMGSKINAWNKFSSTMASAIICLATNQKFNFSKYIFESMVKNLDSVRKFLMYPKFVQVFLNKQVDGMSNHNRIYVIPSHTKKIFGNIKRVGKGFSGRETPLFPTMMVQAQEEMGEDEAVYKELDDSLVRAATTASSLEAEQDSGNIIKTRSKATPNEPGSQGTSSGGGPRVQETIRDTIAQTWSERVSKLSNDSLLAGVNTPRSDEDSLKLNKLMELCTNFQQRVLDLENTKTTQAVKIDSLKRRVKKLERRKRSRTNGIKRLYKVGLSARVDSSNDEQSLGKDASKQGRKINDIDADENITLENVQDAEMFDVTDDLRINAACIATTDSAAATIKTKEITLAKALVEIKTSGPKANGIVLQEPSETTTTTTTTISSKKSQDNGKAILVEEPVKPKKKVQVMLDEEVAKKLQAELDKEDKVAREKAKKGLEANVALIVKWDDIQAKIDVDYQLAERLQAEEQQELSDAEKATLFMQLLEKRRKFFAAKRAEEKRNKPPTQAQQRKIMCTYLKNMEGKQLKDLKTTSFDTIQKMFDRAFKRVNTFVDYKTELLEETTNVDDDKETDELKQLVKIILDEEGIEIDAIPLAVKPPSIGDLKTMFNPHVEDEVWKLQQRYKVVNWKLYNNCGVHCLSLQSGYIYMLVEKEYPLTVPIMTYMLNKKLHAD